MATKRVKKADPPESKNKIVPPAEFMREIAAQVEADIVAPVSSLHDEYAQPVFDGAVSAGTGNQIIPVEQPKAAAPGESVEDFKRRWDGDWSKARN